MIKLTNVTKAYIEDHPVLSNVNLEIKQGDFIVLKGQSGGG